jgi:arginine N-succinyltransferase
MLTIRDASLGDLDELFRLAAFLNTVNLPADRGALEEILHLSEQSFGQQLTPLRREYLFVLEDTAQKKLLGTSMIIAQHGTPESPHIFFEVLRDEKYSSSLNKHFVHQVLKIGYSYNGPTEIGGIVLDPAFRGHPEKLGKQLSFVRFLYIAKHPNRFRRRVIAELLPPLEADGTSVLWESLGRHFTGLSYQEADRISKNNKEFIRTLFPAEGIYASLLPEAVQDIIGEVGPATKGVAKMLEDIGFEYQKRIDPFDGGPHYSARVEDISVILAHKTAAIASERSVNEGAVSDKMSYATAVTAASASSNGSQLGKEIVALVARETETAASGARFACVRARCQLTESQISISEEAKRSLNVQDGDVVSVLPLS